MEDHNKENQLDDSLVWEEVHMEHIVRMNGLIFGDRHGNFRMEVYLNLFTVTAVEIML